MIVSTIRQFGLRLRADPEEIPFQYSANVQMKFEKDENYNDYTVVGYYIPPGENEAKLLSINDDGKFILGPDCFKQRGTLSFSFNLINSQEEVHLGSIDFEIRYAFGDSDTILPEPEEVWISLVTKVAKDAIKEDVALVKQKANEALQSASLANDKANEAQEYANNANQSAGSASLSASSALTAKNDAIAASNSAIQAKQDAEQSANNAKNSANTALENANKSTEAIETVTQIKTEIENKANDFDANYQEKLKSFNDNATSKQNAFDNSVQTANTNFDSKVTQANSDLDAKVQEANTIIDEKVKTVTEQAQKATDEANRAEQATDGKLDKNLGVENAGKSLVVGGNGEVVCGESGINEDEVNKIIDKAIDEKLYTQEEVDYMLADKMDKPYTSIEITDNATITDALEGNFKIDKIKGNTYQNVETDIVPTPGRPVPINSRKVLANGEYVELRSLKESVNIWDNTNIASYDGEGIQFQGWSNTVVKLENSFINLKTNTKYAIKMDVEMVEAIVDDTLTQFSLNKRLLLYRPSSNEFGLPSVSIPLGLYDSIMSNGEVQSISATFTSPEDLRGVVIAGYTERWLDSANKQYCAIVKFKNIMLVEGESAPSTYVAPTVRDYKIVNHDNKTAKIIRNVQEINLNNLNFIYNDTKTDYSRFYTSVNPALKYAGEIYSNVFTSYGTYDYTKEAIYGGNSYGGKVLSITVKDSNVAEHTQEALLEYINNPNAVAYYALETPTEETILYLETDTSEMGLSWQDTTSPSPTIKSEIKGVEEIDILRTGKNIFDVESAKNKENWIESTIQPGYIDFMIRVKKGVKYFFSHDNKLSTGINFYAGIVNAEDITNTSITDWLYHNSVGNLIKNSVTFTTKGEYISLRVSSYGFNNMLENFKNIQIEVNDVKTSYEPYLEQHVNIMLPQPIYQNDIVNVESGNYEYETQKYIVTGNENFIKDYQNQSGYYGRYFILINGNYNDELNQTKAFCNALPWVRYAWDVRKEGFTQNINRQIHLKFSNDRLGIADDTPVEEKRTAFANYLKQLYASGNPLYVVVKVTKTTQPIPPEDLEQLKKLKTSTGVNNVFINGEIKLIINARYPQDVVSAVNKLQTKLLTLQEEVVKNV